MFGQPSQGLADKCKRVKDHRKMCWEIDPVCKRDTGQFHFRYVKTLFLKEKFRLHQARRVSLFFICSFLWPSPGYI